MGKISFDFMSGHLAESCIWGYNMQRGMEKFENFSAKETKLLSKMQGDRISIN